ncbi:hypothetical protein FD755_021802 [Muntiacus reevesi]|uniref:MAP3K7 C-terminal-like protein n=1 Tax=Muntiacus reevesi TaxID=9886 RepID=A0A5N3W218_MUNRE|nr:hypothetical protein FD755_021802 [Muntiacus reevesi]
MVDSNQTRLHTNLEDPEEGQGSGAHMISTARVPADKPVSIAFSLDNAAGMLCSEEKRPPTPPRLLPSYHQLFHGAKELIAKLDQAEKEKLDAAQLAREFEALTEENRTLKLAQSQCVEQLEKLRIQYQKRQGSS